MEQPTMNILETLCNANTKLSMVTQGYTDNDLPHSLYTSFLVFEDQLHLFQSFLTNRSNIGEYVRYGIRHGSNHPEFVVPLSWYCFSMSDSIHTLESVVFNPMSSSSLSSIDKYISYLYTLNESFIESVIFKDSI